ncbi:MAG: ferrous iron transport protein B [Desulfosarcinaceae bacterium]|nr:ferrous iron transport protein B [Desulfosarcinaceae bacterium]
MDASGSQAALNQGPFAQTTIALAGNPNCGKTTLFNALTGARQHVGNYPGVTVEKKTGSYTLENHRLHLVDLPGTYSLTAYSLEEVVARDFIVKERPALVVNIVDATNLERNLYLTLQFMEMGVPVCMALNMMDVAAAKGIEIDVARLANLLGIAIVPTVARRGEGKESLMQAALDAVRQAGADGRRPLEITYGPDIDPVLKQMSAHIAAHRFLTADHRPEWVALKFLENDEQLRCQGEMADPDVVAELDAMMAPLARHLKQTLDTYPEAVIADYRYGYIRSLMAKGVLRQTADHSRLEISDRLDQVLAHRFVGPLLMLAVIWGLYQFTFAVSETPVALLEGVFGWLGSLVDGHLADGLLKSLLLSGIIDGVGGVLGFVPLILFMFLGIAFLEDSGYLARVAFMLDRVFRIFGLHGSSVMAFIVSGGIAGGCAVPGVMASRTLKSPKERLATLLTVPFMNCGAKLPVFALLVGAFFAAHQALMMFLITLVSWAGALLVARLLRSTVISGPPTPFVMELPPYRWPTFRGLAIHTWERTWQYIRKAGTVILAISVVLWAIMTFPRLPAEVAQDYAHQRAAITDSQASDMAATLAQVDFHEAEAALRHSLAGRMGTALEGLSRWAGFDWRTNIALVGGFAAKEVVISTLGTAYSLGEVDPEASTSLADRLSRAPGWRPLTAICLILFVMFYSPCFVSVVCIAREAGSWRWGAFSILFNTVFAFGVAVLVYQAGTLLGL